MTKKEIELQDRILTVLEGNTKALENLYDLLIKWTTPMLPVKPVNLDNNPTGLALHSETPPEQPAETDTKITAEYCRKALKAIRTKLSDKETRTFLFQFGDAKTIPDLDKKYYEDFIARATVIMTAKPKKDDILF